MTKAENATPRRDSGSDDPAPASDDILKRMLSTPPKQHKDERVNPKPTGKSAQKKLAK